MRLFKHFANILAIACVLAGCSAGSGGKHADDDSITYYPPTPGKLEKSEFRSYYNQVKAFYDTVLLTHGFNGAFLVAKKGAVIFEAYNGYANLQKKDSLNEHSAFHLASISKTFTAMAVLYLAQSGKLSLDNDIRNYFPGLPYEGITVKMLLSHRSGLPNYLYFMQKLGWDKKKYCTNQDVVNYLIRFHPDVTNSPGRHFTYCNTNFVLLAIIIEKISTLPYPQFMKHTFFGPLQMSDTYVFTLADTLTAMPSYTWKGIPEQLTFLDATYGDKNIYTTAQDLLKWDQALYTNQLFAPETLQAAFTPYSNEKPGIRNYGYGWRMNIYPNGKKIVFHNGWWHGSNTVLMRLIEDSATVIVLGNKYNRTIYDAKKLANIFQPYFETDQDEQFEKEGPVSSDTPNAASNIKKVLHKVPDPVRNKQKKKSSSKR